MSEIINKTKGVVKQAVGKAVGNNELRREGERDERKGQIEGAVDDVKHAIKGAAEDAKDTLKKMTK